MLSESRYQIILNNITDNIFRAWEDSYKDFAKDSGISLSTIYNLGNFKTKRPQLRTILKLAKAAGIKIEFDFETKRILKIAQ